ncbi:mitochondrial ribosomal protein [Lepidopterella palustris CBS 459.81]|uniref:37S ribosomal protein S25, mitochondrial n=1 Tax=Lepidopterella palustris CBS 459.81 TaxID=1314670 RepID=A0A8E2E5V0_9PEZI|nr:mitochondrial ribosomal protein [Lepidopterella palustris CBS 459.81]
MGRYDFRALRVRQSAKQLFDNRKITALPPWYEVVGNIPPAETLVRPVMRTPRTKGTKKPSRMFQPMPIKYPEDKLRSEFFGDHPWELARPRIILEDNGNDAKGWDWSRIVQPGKKLDGESVVQRQLWLMQNDNLTKEAAYDQARREFYHHRHLEDVQRRVAKEEALATGAYFGKGVLEIGMELEDQAYENWKAWAQKQIDIEKQNREQLYSGPVEKPDGAGLDDEELDEALDKMEDAIPAGGQGAIGGAAIHP